MPASVVVCLSFTYPLSTVPDLLQSGRLFLWSTASYAELDVWECGAFGACTSMSSIGWAQHTDRRSDSPQVRRRPQLAAVCGGCGLDTRINMRSMRGCIQRMDLPGGAVGCGRRLREASER